MAGVGWGAAGGAAQAAGGPNKEKALAALIPFVNAAAKARPFEVWLKIFGKNQKVKVADADAQGITVRIGKNELPMRWTRIPPRKVAEIGGAALRGRPERALAVADYCLAAGLKAQADAVLTTALQLDKEKKFREAIARRLERLKKLSGGGSKPSRPKRPLLPKSTFAAKEPGAWPQYGFDGGCRFATPGALKFPLVAKWRYVAARPVFNIASTIIHKDRVVLSCVGDHNGNAKIGDPANNPYLLCLNLKDGSKAWAWSHKHDWAIGCALAVAKGAVVFNDDGFGGVDLEKGTRAWGGGADSWGSISVDVRAGWMIRSNTMKVDNKGPNIAAYRLAGKRKWVALQEGGAKMRDGMPFCSIAQGAGRVFITARWAGPGMKRSQGFYALKQNDGSEAWKLAGAWGGVSFSGRYAYAVKKDDGKLHCLDPASGKTVWSASVGGEAHHPPALGRGLCVVLTDAGQLLAFPAEGKRAGKELAWQGHTAPPFTRKALFLSGARMGGNRNVLDERFHTYRRSMLAIAEGADKNGALILANGAMVQALDLKNGRVLWGVPWDEKKLGPAGNPVIANGRLVINSHKAALCFGSQ